LLSRKHRKAAFLCIKKKRAENPYKHTQHTNTKIASLLACNLLSVGVVTAGNVSNNEVETAMMSAAWFGKSIHGKYLKTNKLQLWTMKN